MKHLKKTYTIAQLAEETGITPRSIRHYVARGVLPPPEGLGRYAYYDESHLERLRKIKKGLQEGWTLDRIAAWLDDQNPGNPITGESPEQSAAQEIFVDKTEADVKTGNVAEAECAVVSPSFSVLQGEDVYLLRINPRISVLVSKLISRGEREALEVALSPFVEGKGHDND